MQKDKRHWHHVELTGRWLLAPSVLTEVKGNPAAVTTLLPRKDLRTRMACCSPTPFFMRELRSLTLAPRGILEGPSDHQRKGGDINKSSRKTMLTVLPMRILYIKFGLRVHVIVNALVISTIRLLKDE